MRASLLLVSGIVFVGLPIGGGCASSKPPPRPPLAVVAPPPTGRLVVSDAGAPRADLVPKVIRRIAKEDKELVERSRSMASELRDLHGRERALGEVDELAAALSRIVERIGPGDEVPSEILDNAVTELQLLDTRITLLHATLRAATERTTAVLLE